ncbi:MAG: gamma-glutamyltranspeptidase/glutathione hydrolase, partial [Congregibacter sp.]
MNQYSFLCLFIFTSLMACSSETVPTKEKKSPVMVVTANPHATEAGLEILRAGGSAVDAAIAIEAVLSLVEPQSSGLAGGGFMVHFDASENAISVFDGRETA